MAAPQVERQGNWLSIPQIPDLRIQADRTRLKQALLHLLNNAAKFSGRDEIALVIRPADDRHIDIQVRDKGRGMSRETLERALQPFGTAADPIPTSGGSGLNLALSRGLCEAMGGTFLAESEPGRGSRFTLRLPLATPATQAQ